MVQWTEKPAPRIEAAKPEAPEDLTPRPRYKSSSRQPARRGLLQVAVVCVMFGLILASYTLFSYVPNTTAQTIREPGPASVRDVSAGRIIVSDRASCRELGFDNHSGQTTAKGTVACGEAAAQPGDPAAHSAYRHPTNRLDAIRRSFTPQ